MKANQSSMRYIFGQIKIKNFGQTKIYTKSEGLARFCQLHRLARLNTSVRRYIARRQNWNICLTVVML